MQKRFNSVGLLLLLSSMTSNSVIYASGIPKIASVQDIQQTSVCTGIVKDSQGETIIGASVLVKGTNNGVITGLDGSFSLNNVSKGATIQISFVGFKTIELVWKGSPLNVVLEEDAEVLDEVVVMGYGIKQKRGKLTNSISKVSEETLTVGSYGDPAQALVGAVAGVKVNQTSGFAGSTPSIVLRGGTNFDGSGSPIVVVDGQIRSEGLSDINPNDIESMEILKDAGATALYGARASNGVILVTTKQGKAGKATVNFNMKVGAQYYVPQYEMMDAEGYIYWMRKAYANTPWASSSNLTSSSNPAGIGRTELDASTVWNIMEYTGSAEQQELLKKGWALMDDPVSDATIIYKNTNPRDYNINSPAITQDYNLNFSGGNDRGNYYAGIGYYDSEGLSIGTDYKRYTFSLTGNYKIAKWLESTSIFNYNRANYLSSPAKSNGDSYYFGRIESLPPTIRLADEDGNNLLGSSITDGNYQYEADKFIRDYQTDKFSMTQSLEATLLKGLKLKGTMAWNYSEYLGEAFNKDYHTNQAETSVNSTRSSSATFYRTFNQTYNLLLSYDGTFGDHNISAMLGTEYYDTNYKYFTASGQEAPTDDFQDLEYTSTEAGKRSIDSEHTQQRILSYFGRAQYDYKGRYILAATFREDGYSSLINNRWGFFPGVSAGWIFSQEDFFKPLSSIINYGKLRTSFGLNGNASDIGAYTLQGAYSSYTYNSNIGYRLSTLANPSLRWEKTRTAEVGFDLGFLSNKYTFGFTFYDRLTSDKYASLTLPSTTGFSSVTNNNGKFRNRGIELEFGANLINTKDFRWSLNGNISYNKNTVIQLPENSLENNRQGGTEIYTGNGPETYYVGGLQEGHTPYDVIVGYGVEKMARTVNDLPDGYCDVSQSVAVYYGEKGYQKLQELGWTGSAYELECGDLIYEDMNGDGVIDEFDQKVLGNYTPKWNGGFNTTLSWKGLTLYARFDFGLGFYSYDGLRQWFNGCAQGTYNMTTDIWDSWTEDNIDAKYPRFVWADQLGTNNYVRTSEYWITKGNYLAFREIQLSYTFPTKITQKFRCQGLTVSVTGQNLGYLTSSSCAIPDYIQYTSGNTSGWGGTYSMPRTVLFGLNVTF